MQLLARQAMWLLQLQAMVLVWYAMHRCVTAYLIVFSSIYTTTCAADDSLLSLHLVLVAELSSIWSQLCVVLQQQRNKLFLLLRTTALLCSIVLCWWWATGKALLLPCCWYRACVALGTQHLLLLSPTPYAPYS